MSGTAIFGGTFDPVHYGHIQTVEAVYKTIKPEKIIFIPAKIPPFKTDKTISGDEHRKAMLKLALKDYPQFHVDSYELDNEGISYTITTLLHLSSIYKELKLIIGYDNYVNFDKWHRCKEIIELTELLVMRRNVEDENVEHDIPATFVNTPLVNISSTIIRNNILAGKPVTGMLPGEVEKYIYEHNLYSA